MTRKLASIQTIISLEPISNADSLELASVLGWKVVVKKGEFRISDRCIYIEIDSILPERSEFEFLRSKEFRIKTCRLRGVISQGICFPLSILNGLKYPDDTRDNPVYDFKVGKDVTALIGVRQYEPLVSVQIGGDALGSFPLFIPKTDEMRIQAVPEILERHRGKQFYFTQKLDGSSMTVYRKGDHLGVCSRNLELKETTDSAMWRVARESRVFEVIGDRDLALQGEICGPGIQRNRLGLEKVSFFLFNVYDIRTGTQLSYEQFLEFGREVTTVPILGEFMLDLSIDDLVKMASISSKVPSLDGAIRQAEGIVCRPIIECYDFEVGRLSFKVINPEYLIEHKE